MEVDHFLFALFLRTSRLGCEPAQRFLVLFLFVSFLCSFCFVCGCKQSGRFTISAINSSKEVNIRFTHRLCRQTYFDLSSSVQNKFKIQQRKWAAFSVKPRPYCSQLRACKCILQPFFLYSKNKQSSNKSFTHTSSFIPITEFNSVT